MNKYAVVAFFGINSFICTFAAYAQPPPVTIPDQQAVFITGPTEAPQVVLSTKCLTVTPTYAVQPQSRASPLFMTQLKPNGDGNKPGGARDIIAASLRPLPTLTRQKGFIQPVAALSQSKEVFRDVAAACLRPCCLPTKKSIIKVAETGAPKGVLVISLSTARSEWE